MPTQLMGILNATPDSFYDGGRYANLLHRGLELFAEGADIIDIGGESTRPGSLPVSTQEELARVIPLVRALSKQGRVSIDTSKATVAQAAIDAGATFINDITGLIDPEMVKIAIASDQPVCVMHMQGIPQTMQSNPHYPKGVLEEILDWFRNKTEALLEQGLKKEHIILDPGIGFGKSVADNLKILHNLPIFKALGFPILLGLSRKSFLQKILSKPVEEMLAPTLGLNALAVQAGVEIIRVHDVKEHRMLINVLKEL